MAEPGSYCAGRVKYLTEAETDTVLRSTITKELLERMYTLSPERPIVRDHREFLRYSALTRLGYCNGKLSFGGHFSAFRKDIEAVNGYDENFVGWGGEDIDLARRMCMAGFRGRSVITTARVLHMWHSRELGNKHWKEGPNVEYFLRKNVPVFCKNGLKKENPES
jgi:GT2 family glycosyltransferase